MLQTPPNTRLKWQDITNTLWTQTNWRKKTVDIDKVTASITLSHSERKMRERNVNCQIVQRRECIQPLSWCDLLTVSGPAVSLSLSPWKWRQHRTGRRQLVINSFFAFLGYNVYHQERGNLKHNSRNKRKNITHEGKEREKCTGRGRKDSSDRTRSRA